MISLDFRVVVKSILILMVIAMTMAIVYLTIGPNGWHQMT